MIQKTTRLGLAALLLSAHVGLAQPTPTEAEDLMAAIAMRKQMADGSMLAQYPARSIGPVVQGARITELAVNEANPQHYFVAYASGGVFETKNNGVTFEPIFDHVGALTIGALALAPSDSKVLYVGTGENNSSRSSYAGSGMYKTTDGGSTWSHLGLDATQHIGRIVVHPSDPNTVWVASMGALYSHNEARGVYKSTDGGASWNKTLYINDSVGIIDLVIDPKNPNNLLAAAWERTRHAWDFKGNGPGSAIYRSTDGGETWAKAVAGFPQDEKVGRIGLDYYHSDPSIVYAVMDYQMELPGDDDDEEAEGLQFVDFLEFSAAQIQDLNHEDLESFLRDNGFPAKYTAKRVKADVKAGKYTATDIANYSGDANAALFNTNVAGASVYKSTDGGETWAEVEGSPIEGVFFTYGYYFAQIRVSPTDPNRLFVHGVPLITSADGGKTWARSDTVGDVHADHHAQWINPNNADHIILGNDGGLYVSYDGGAYWDHINNTATGQFYTVSVDNAEPYNVYGGLQDNGSLVGSSKSVPNRTGFWDFVFGGDGMYILADPRDNQRVYTGFQFGNYFRVDRSGKERPARITPSHDIGEPVLRYNWRTPVVMSSHNPDILYIGSQRVYRSLNRGDSWEAISGDLTQDLPQGNVPHSTISTLSESPLKFGLLYAGSDDGLVWVTRNGGATWDNISAGLPTNLWVSSVQASSHDEGTVLVTLNGYRYDDFKSYVYRSTDYGKTWTALTANLPQEVANVIVQDPVNASLYYLGTDGGTYVSLNAGQSWMLLPGIPNVASYDMVVHPTARELVVATHGRSIYVMDVKPLQEATANAQLLVWGPASLRHRENWGEKRYPYTEVNEPTVTFRYFARGTAPVEVQVLNEAGETVRTLKALPGEGFYVGTWDVRVDVKDRRGRPTGEQTYAGKGKYTFRLTQGSITQEHAVEIK